MIKLAFFDYSKTIIKGSGNGAIANFMGKGEEFDEIFENFVSNKISDEEFISSAIGLWRGFDLERLLEIIENVEPSENIQEVLKQLKNEGIKLALVSHIPQQLADLYKEWGFDYTYGNECEVRNGKFTGKVLKINPDKGYMVKSLCDELTIKYEYCIAVGDSRADIGMFKVVGYDNSFAYNANEEVKKYAKYHIKDFKEIVPIIKLQYLKSQ